MTSNKDVMYMAEVATRLKESSSVPLSQRNIYYLFIYKVFSPTFFLQSSKFINIYWFIGEIIESIELIAEAVPDWCKLSHSIEEKRLVKIDHSFPSKEVPKLIQERFKNIKL